MQVIAHRGFAGLRVENTLAAFAHAIELGAAGAELDVHLSRDGQVVVHHDDTLNPDYCRHLHGDWIRPAEALPLAVLSFAEMQAFEIGKPRPGSACARRFPDIQPTPNQRIPLLREVVRLARHRSQDFKLVVEIKTPPQFAAQQPWRPLLEATLDVLHEEDFLDRAILCSFDWGPLIQARVRHPQLATWCTTLPQSWFHAGPVPPQDLQPAPGELEALHRACAGGEAPWYAGHSPARYGGDITQAVRAAGGRAWFPWNRDLRAEHVRRLAAAGLEAAAWTSNLRDPAELTRLIDTGVDWLVLDYPPGLG